MTYLNEETYHIVIITFVLFFTSSIGIVLYMMGRLYKIQHDYAITQQKVDEKIKIVIDNQHYFHNLVLKYQEKCDKVYEACIINMIINKIGRCGNVYIIKKRDENITVQYFNQEIWATKDHILLSAENEDIKYQKCDEGYLSIKEAVENIYNVVETGIGLCSYFMIKIYTYDINIDISNKSYHVFTKAYDIKINRHNKEQVISDYTRDVILDLVDKLMNYDDYYVKIRYDKDLNAYGPLIFTNGFHDININKYTTDWENCKKYDGTYY